MNLWNIRKCYLAFLMVFYVFYHPTDSEAILITSENIDMILASNELVVLNFFAEWCHFSNILAPIFNEAAEKVKKEYPEPGKVIFGRVNCESEQLLAKRFHITKYPTIKIVQNGELNKHEYRGQRSAQAFLDFVRKQLQDPIREYENIEHLVNLDNDKRIIIGYFDRRDQPEYDILRRVATNLKDDCQFHVGFGLSAHAKELQGTPIIVFRPDTTSNDNNETYKGSVSDFDELKAWIQGKCIPLVREITFQNAEELTEEGLPFLILFHHPNDTNSIKEFKTVIEEQLLDEKQNINFLTADGIKFAHPLHHLHKSEEDLPLIAIDSFRHMYLFPDFKDMHTPGKLKGFLKDLYSGKLHREFHYGPDPSTNDVQIDVMTSPPESTFKKLGPSKNRYTLLHKDEL